MKTVYDLIIEGGKARQNSLPIEQCPYDTSRERFYWIKGWKFCDSEILWENNRQQTRSG